MMSSLEARGQRGGTVLFELSFQSDMGPSARELLRRELYMVDHLDHKLAVDPTSEAFARLDHGAGLYLDPDGEDGHWRLQARSWGRPPARTVKGWQLRSAAIVRQLDPSLPPQTA